jgi:hypothetical protein
MYSIIIMSKPVDSRETWCKYFEHRCSYSTYIVSPVCILRSAFCPSFSRPQPLAVPNIPIQRPPSPIIPEIVNHGGRYDYVVGQKPFRAWHWVERATMYDNLA